MEHTFSISDAARQLNVESHVLRYWEEELLLNIPRNEHGHRFYRESDINTFIHIKELKEKGLSLQEIKNKLSKSSSLSLTPVNNDNKLDQFREIMNSIISTAVTENSEHLIKEMNYLFRALDEDQEARLTKIEQAIAGTYSAKNQSAATKEQKSKKKTIFSRKKSKKKS